VTILFDGDIQVHYGFVFLQPEGLSPDLYDCFRDQGFGLCGAAVSGVLAMTTGLHTGAVPLVVEVLTAEPPMSPEWQDVLEVPFATKHHNLSLSSFEHRLPVRLPEIGNYRARWNAAGMDLAHGVAVRGVDDPEIDRYLLQLWPAAPAPGLVLKQASRTAEYEHATAGRPRLAAPHPASWPPPYLNTGPAPSRQIIGTVEGPAITGQNPVVFTGQIRNAGPLMVDLSVAGEDMDVLRPFIGRRVVITIEPSD
jgi:hypothetical protein